MHQQQLSDPGARAVPVPFRSKVEFDPELITRLGKNGPRYTSYPTADRFVEAFGADEYGQALQQRRAAGACAQPLSLYVHIPF